MKIRRTGLFFLLPPHILIPDMPGSTSSPYLMMDQRRRCLGCRRSRVRSRRCREQAEYSRGQAHGNMSRQWTPEYGRARGGRGMQMSWKRGRQSPVESSINIDKGKGELDVMEEIPVGDPRARDQNSGRCFSFLRALCLRQKMRHWPWFLPALTACQRG